MGEVLGVLAVTLLLACAAVGMYRRDSDADEHSVEASFRDPRTHTVVYAIPGGVDPAMLLVALDRAGFGSETHEVGVARRLLVACLTTERTALRGVIEAAHATTSTGSELMLGHVVFEDER